ncbi:MAG: hypothetical protein JNK26_03715 [Candidatus Doudnabacteria bacterium]|nr:hypothetical protein [Candidatus Doudnabacteria bacterium]
MLKFLRRLKAGHRPYKILVTFFLVVALSCTVGYLMWAAYIRPQPQVVAGINLRRQPITVEILGQSVRLEMFDTFHKQFEVDGTLEVKIFSDDGQLIESRVHDVGQQPGLLMELFVENSELYQCVIEADVTNKYYSGKVKLATGDYPTRVINPYPGRSFYTYIDKYIDKYVFLDTYNGRLLPTNVDSFTKILGYYFVPCADIEDKEKVQDWLSWWQNYNPTPQRALYQAEIDRINNTTTYR